MMKTRKYEWFLRACSCDPVCGYCGQVCATVSVRETHEARHEREGE